VWWPDVSRVAAAAAGRPEKEVEGSAATASNEGTSSFLFRVLGWEVRGDGVFVGVSTMPVMLAGCSAGGCFPFLLFFPFAVVLGLFLVFFGAIMKMSRSTGFDDFALN
jgi:hypothetical protein